VRTSEAPPPPPPPPFLPHRAEEIYVILSGRGRVKLNDRMLEVQPLDAIRVAPRTARAFEAGPDGLESLAFGPHHPGDGEPVEDSWTDRQAAS
jgi:mannose-6-phosphate isomerase-like protein (cupin superfamily)